MSQPGKKIIKKKNKDGQLTDCKYASNIESVTHDVDHLSLRHN